MNTEKIRQIGVISFIVLGLIALGYEKLNAPKIYKGVGEGFADEIVVEVAAKKDSNGNMKVYDLKVKHGDTPEVANPAIEKITEQLKTTGKADVVSGATYTSEGVIEAVKNAGIKF